MRRSSAPASTPKRTNRSKLFHSAGTVKYESPKGPPNETYIPPGTFAAIDDPRAELIVTEGEKKSLKADQEGFYCIGLVGVYGWKEKGRERLIPSLNRVAWKGRRAFIAFDSDIADKPEVPDAENRLAYHLGQLGAIVRCIRIPAGPADAEGKPTKQGLDDFLVAQGKDGLFALIKEAGEPGEVSSVEMKAQASELDPASEVSAYLKTSERDGVQRLRYWRGSFWLWRQGYDQELPASEVRSHLVNHVNRNYCKLTTGVIANCVMQLQAQTLLGSHLEAPSWIGDGEPPFSAAETLVCRNGLLHLPSYLYGIGGTHFRPLTPRFFSTCGLDFNFDPDSSAPTEWEKFLGTLWPDDADSIYTLREWFGYALLPDTSQHKILLLVGPPRSGKGTIARVLRQLVGEKNIAAPTLSSLGTNFGLSPLVGKSLAIIADARLGGRADIAATTERLLSISGEDAQTIDRKNQEAITCKLPTRFVILTNELPRFADSSGALANRMVILQMQESFLGREDKGLFERLKSELPGVLLWSIVGWDRLRRRGHFAEPASSAELRGDLNDLASPIAAFIRERCDVGPQHNVARATLYDEYKRWCSRMGRQSPEEHIIFGRGLRSAIPKMRNSEPRHDGKRVGHYEGVGLKPSAAEGYLSGVGTGFTPLHAWREKK